MIVTPKTGDGFLESVMTTVGKDQPVPMTNRSSAEMRNFVATLTATPGATASVRCRPLAAATEGAPGFATGGEVTLSGTADANGLVGTDGFSYWCAFDCTGFETLSISGAGASVKMRGC